MVGSARDRASFRDSVRERAKRPRGEPPNRLPVGPLFSRKTPHIPGRLPTLNGAGQAMRILFGDVKTQCRYRDRLRVAKLDRYPLTFNIAWNHGEAFLTETQPKRSRNAYGAPVGNAP